MSVWLWEFGNPTRNTVRLNRENPKEVWEIPSLGRILKVFEDKQGGSGGIEDRHELQTERKRRRSVEVSRRLEISSMRSFGRWVHSAMVGFSRARK